MRERERKRERRREKERERGRDLESHKLSKLAFFCRLVLR
jgi:hypothetical protein